METAGWLHSHWSCHYTDDCKNEAGKERSGFDILATALPLCFHIKVWDGNGESNAVCFLLGGSVHLWLCYWSPYFFLQFSPKLRSDTLISFEKKKAGPAHKFICRQTNTWHAFAYTNIRCIHYFKWNMSRQASLCLPLMHCFIKYPVFNHLACC